MAPREMPELVPVLTRGKHRSPKKGACFMEYVSFLADERWSDHPKCTHPLLAGVARIVNDLTSDKGRPRLVPWIPSVIGLTGDDPAVDVGIAMRCAAIALPVVAEHRQRALTVGLLSARQVLADITVDRGLNLDTSGPEEHSQRALARVPHVARWAQEFVSGRQMKPKVFQRRSAPAILRVAAVGISEACIPDPDDLLYELLSTVITDCTMWLGSTPSEQAVQKYPALISANRPARH